MDFGPFQFGCFLEAELQKCQACVHSHLYEQNGETCNKIWILQKATAPHRPGTFTSLGDQVVGGWVECC